MRRQEKKEFKQKKIEWTKATTTPLVSDVFETFFTEQLDNDAVAKVDSSWLVGSINVTFNIKQGTSSWQSWVSLTFFSIVQVGYQHIDGVISLCH